MAMHIHVQGNLAKDPEFHPYGDNNTGVRARLVIASERERGKHDTPDYFDVTVFGDVAERFRTAAKGDPVAVSGENGVEGLSANGDKAQFSYQFVGHETVWQPRAAAAINKAANNARSYTDGVAVSPAR